MHRFQRIVVAGVTAAVVVGLVSIEGSSAAISLPDNTCSTSTPCLTVTNNGTGEAIDGTASKNNGVHGTTHFKSTSSTNFKAGVLGLDLSSLGSFDAGVEGQSTLGFGLMGISLSGTGVSGTAQAFGVSGTSTGTGTGVFGLSPATGVVGESTGGIVGVLGAAASGSGIGVEGFGAAVGVQGDNTSSSFSIAVLAQGSGGTLFAGSNSASQFVYGVDDSGSEFLAGSLMVTGGVMAECQAPACGTEPIVGMGSNSSGVLGTTNSAGAAGVVALGGGGDIFIADSKQEMIVAWIENNGDIHTSGKIFTSGSCHLGCAAPNHPGKRVTSYAPRESQPTMEDFGEAQLVNGAAYVRLDPTFANVIDSNANYLVFITPEGDCRVLYVTQKTGSGFAVRESEAGKSTVAFSYRIVAKPYGEDSPRLPMTEAVSDRHRLPKLHVPHLPTPHRSVLPSPPGQGLSP